ncbi:MAG: hypothetical protein SVN78_03145, partial [Deferribacterota bacterium]|nr:hypothetical protein [Deferribacterota bacterium]
FASDNESEFNRGFIDLDTVSVVGYYDNYTTDYYLYEKKGETTSSSGQSLIECGPTEFKFNIVFDSVEKRDVAGIGLNNNETLEMSELLIEPGVMNFLVLDNKTTPSIDSKNLPTFGGLVEPLETANYSVNFKDIPSPGYEYLELLKWGDDPYKYILDSNFDIFEFRTGVNKKLCFFKVPYNIIGCDSDCRPFYCTANGINFGGPMTAEVSDINPDRVEAYRDETGGHKSVVTLKITYKKVEEMLYEALENIIEDWVLNPEDSGIQNIRNILIEPIVSFSQASCSDSNNSGGDCELTNIETLCAQNDNPGLYDYLFCGLEDVANRLPMRRINLILSSITSGLSDYFENPSNSIPLNILQLFSEGWPAYGFRVNYVKVEYEPVDNAPVIPPFVYDVTEKYGQNYAYLRSPDLFEWYSNTPVEKIVDFDVIDGDTIEEIFKGYHHQSFEYDFQMYLYLSGDYPSRAKIERSGKLYIDLDN